MIKLVFRDGGRFSGEVYPGGGGDLTGYPVMPPRRNMSSPLLLDGNVFVPCASTRRVGALGLLKDRFTSSGLKVLLSKPCSYSNRVTDMLKLTNTSFIFKVFAKNGLYEGGKLRNSKS